jgi:hypothetical protein
MITCKACDHEERPGALFCSKCGNKLIYPETTPIDQIETLVIDRIDSFSIPSFPSPPADSSESRVALFLLNSGDVIHISGGDDFTVGRSTKGQTIIPDIDLNAYNAYESGVSRLHANINITDSDVFIHDLGSANGTRLNGKRIDSHIEYPVKNGDILGLGQLKIQVLVKQATGELLHGN